MTGCSVTARTFMPQSAIKTNGAMDVMWETVSTDTMLLGVPPHAVPAQYWLIVSPVNSLGPVVPLPAKLVTQASQLFQGLARHAPPLVLIAAQFQISMWRRCPALAANPPSRNSPAME